MQGEDSEPPMNSLYNIQNMQKLVMLGESTTNIMVNTTVDFSAITLDQGWADLTTTLGLSSTDQTYFLWLWLYNAQIASFSFGVNGSSQYGYVGVLAAESFEE